MGAEFFIQGKVAHLVEHSFHLEARLLNNLCSLCNEMKLDLLTVVQSAFAVLVHRYTGREDVRVIVNSERVRVILTGDLTFHEVLRRVRTVPQEEFWTEHECTSVSVLSWDESQLEFSLAGADTDTTVERLALMAEHFLMLLQGIISDANQLIAAIPILSELELNQLLDSWEQSAAEYPRDACLHELFEEQAARTPDAVAVVCGSDYLTYGELNARANQVARYLRGLGVQPDELVGICVERSIEMMIGLLGILKAGGAYVPLDPVYPKSRLHLILEDANPSIILTQTKCKDTLPEHVTQILCIDSDFKQLALEDTGNLDRVTASEKRAYVIYTSGSTGKPKGVQIPHSAVVNLLHSMRKNPGICEQDVFLALASFSFDMSIPELYLPLMTGAKLVLGRHGIAGDGEKLLELIQRECVSIMQATPTTWRLLLEAGLKADGRLRVLCGAEPLPPQLLTDLLDAGFVVWNLYGPTETTVWSLIRCIDTYKGGVVPIGIPIDNTQIYILNEKLQPVPAGVAGELVIGGAGVAIGYLNRPVLTAEKFIEHPFRDQLGARLYRTGDLVRRTLDGEIEYLGRIDHQVKIRGFRVELGEIEAQLESHPYVRAVVVLARVDKHGNQRLCGYVQSHAEETVTGEQLRRFLQDRLPAYMVPVTFAVLESLPLNPNGKVDRKALQELDLDMEDLVSTADYVAPQNETERLVTQVLEEILPVVRVGVTDNFLALGGDSLLAARVVSKVRRVLSIHLEVRDLLEAKTIEDFAAKVEHILDQGRQEEQPLRPVCREGVLPLSFSQRRLWFLDQLEEGQTAFYNLPLVWVLRGSFDHEVLERCLQEIVVRHETLRTTFQSVGGQPVQVISEPEWELLNVFDLREYPVVERQRRVLEAAQKESAWRFDLRTGPLFRANLLQIDEKEHVLLLNMHHIISDGWSLGLLRRELVMLYDAFVEGKDSPLSELPIQYVDYIVWQQERLSGEVLENHLAYWRHKLGGKLPILELPVDRPRGDRQTFNGGARPFVLSKELVGKIKEFGKQDGFTPFILLLAAYKLLLAHTARLEDVLVGSPVANRDREELEGLIGFFVNTLVYRTDLSGNPTLREVLERVRETAYAAYAHQETPFEKVVEDLQPKRDLRFPPLFQVWFVLHNTPDFAEKSRHIELHDTQLETGTVQFDLSLAVQDKGQTMNGELSYNCDLFEAETIELQTDLYVEIVRTLVEEPTLHTHDLFQTLQKEINRRKTAKQRSFKESRLASIKKRAVQPVILTDER